MWDPYGKLNDLPVAVVNLDKTSELNGKKIQTWLMMSLLK